MRLTGDRNQCRGCGEYFNSTFAFDKHRTGDFGKDRRCMTMEEMMLKGMEKNDAGFWVGKRMDSSVTTSLKQTTSEQAKGVGAMWVDNASEVSL
jgi:hypothetical protein